MITVNIREEDEFIKLGQALKKPELLVPVWMPKWLFRWAGFGKRSDRTSTRKKLHNGDVVTFQGETIQIVQ